MLDHSPMLRSRSFEETRTYLAQCHAIDMDRAGPEDDGAVDVRLNALFLRVRQIAGLDRIQQLRELLTEIIGVRLVAGGR